MDWLSHDRLGFNYRMSDVTAAIGVAQVERLDALLAERARVAGLYRERLGAIEGLVLPCEDAGAERRSWFVYVVQVPEGADRDVVIERLAAGGRRVEGVPASDPPAAVLPGAVRLPRRGVPGGRGCRRDDPSPCPSSRPWGSPRSTRVTRALEAARWYSP